MSIGTNLKSLRKLKLCELHKTRRVCLLSIRPTRLGFASYLVAEWILSRIKHVAWLIEANISNT